MDQKISCTGWGRCEWKLSEYELDQILAEALHKLGADRIMEYVEPNTRIYSWPIPPDRRHVVAAAIASLVHWSKS
jgi:hypothetical protein